MTNTPQNQDVMVYVVEQLDNLVKITTMVEERISVMQKNYDVLNNKVTEAINELHSMRYQIELIKSRVPENEIHQIKEKLIHVDHEIDYLRNRMVKQKNLFDRVFDWAFRIIFIIVTSYILYLLGIQGFM